MRIHTTRYLLCFVILTMTTFAHAKKTQEPFFSMTFNPLETASFIALNLLLVEEKLTYVPLHFDADLRFNDWIGLAMGLVYRYENYHDQGPLYSASGRVRPKSVWTNYHEIYLLAGPRFSPLNTGIEGFFISVKGGLGAAISPKYFNLTALLQPDIGYTFFFGTPGFTLTLAAGVLLQMPFYESLPFAAPWNMREPHTAIGILVHQATPILNVGLGFNI